MDSFCIDRGTLLDKPSVITLEKPERHSVHCLVDVRSCVNSDFEVLLDPLIEEGETLYARGWRLDEPSKQQVISLARSVGRSCSTCESGGTIRQGFRAVLRATVLDLNENVNLPPLIQVGDSAHSNDLQGDACQEIYNLTNVLELENYNRTAFKAEGSGSSLQQKKLIHGSLMLISWGFLLPSGTIFARFFKHRPDGLWFQIHKVVQSIGLFIAVIGFIIALRNFNVFGDKGYNNYRHGICGCITMGLGILQPISACLRPDATEPGGKPTMARKLWEYWHKGAGYAAVIMAIVTIALGTTSLAKVDDQKKFQYAYGIGCGGLLLLLFLGIQKDKAREEEK